MALTGRKKDSNASDAEGRGNRRGLLAALWHRYCLVLSRREFWGKSLLNGLVYLLP